MMVYKWPISLINKLESAMMNFIWSGDVMKKGSVTVAWNRCCTPLDEGGLNLRSIRTMNEAFLMRLAWDIHCNIVPFADILKLRFLDRLGCPKRSYLKSSIWSGLKPHLVSFDIDGLLLIGHKSKARFWLDNWLGYTIADRLNILSHVKKEFGSNYITIFL